MIRQVYRIKYDGNLKENSDMAQDKEKTIIGEILVSSIDQIVPNDELVLEHVAEFRCGEDRGTTVGAIEIGLADPKICLDIFLQKLNRVSDQRTTVGEQSFEELLARYQKEITQKQRNQPKKAEYSKLPPRNSILNKSTR